MSATLDQVADLSSGSGTLTGIASGSPLIFIGNISTSGTFSIGDNFATPYTWTRVSLVNFTGGGFNLVLYVGTGGSGTSGTVSVGAMAAYGGAVYSFIGADTTSSGLAVIDGSGTGSATFASLTPSSAGECIIGGVSSQYGTYPSAGGTTPTVVLYQHALISNWFGFVIAGAAYGSTGNPPAGVATNVVIPNLGGINISVVALIKARPTTMQIVMLL